MTHPMTQFAEESASKFIALIIWKLRLHCPNLSVEITNKDMAVLAGAFSNMITVAVIGRKDSILIQLVDAETGEKLSADSTLNENSIHAQGMARLLEARRRAHSVAERLLQFRNVNDKELMQEAAEILKLLTWEPE